MSIGVVVLQGTLVVVVCLHVLGPQTCATLGTQTKERSSSVSSNKRFALLLLRVTFTTPPTCFNSSIALYISMLFVGWDRGLGGTPHSKFIVTDAAKLQMFVLAGLLVQT